MISPWATYINRFEFYRTIFNTFSSQKQFFFLQNLCTVVFTIFVVDNGLHNDYENVKKKFTFQVSRFHFFKRLVARYKNISCVTVPLNISTITQIWILRSIHIQNLAYVIPNLNVFRIPLYITSHFKPLERGFNPSNFRRFYWMLGVHEGSLCALVGRRGCLFRPFTWYLFMIGLDMTSESFLWPSSKYMCTLYFHV